MATRKKVDAPPPNTKPIDPALWKRYADARLAMADWKEVLDDARKDIEAVLVDDEFATVDGVPVIAWKHGKRSALSQKLLKQLYPDVLSECTEITETRTFTVL